MQTGTIRYIQDVLGNKVLPITHLSAVRNANGDDLNTLMANVPFMGADDNSALVDVDLASINDTVVVVTANAVPTSSTLTYTDSFGKTRNYKVGDQVKVYNSTDSVYDIYTLLNNANSTAVWQKGGAVEQVQPDWNQTDSTAADYIKNKPLIIGIEHVTVTVTLPNGNAAEGMVVSINNTDYTLDSNGQASVDIAAGTEYTVITPTYTGIYRGSTLTYTASQLVRNVSIQYSEYAYGVFAYYSDGSLSTSGTSDAIGVAVVTSNCQFVIGKTDSGSSMGWGGYSTSLASTGIVTTTTSSAAMLDYAGDSNTTKIISVLGSNAVAASWCRTQFNGAGYLPSLGEWKAAYDNKTEVDAMMYAIGGTAIQSKYYWASTLYDASQNSWMLHWTIGNTTNSSRSIYSDNYYVRAFLAF